MGRGDAAEDAYREAIERLDRSGAKALLARTHLVFGEWLRRERRRRAAGEQLRGALEMLTDMGMEAFAHRAERELLRTGERVRKRVVETRGDLTAQEAQIARLARDGLSNPEIGALAVYQPPDRPISPPQGLHQARHHVAQPTRRSAAARANRRSSLPRLTARPSACRSTLGGRTRTAHGAATDDAGGMVLLEDLE